MITSMTGYGRGEATKNGKTVTVEIRSVNSRYLEISSNLPKKYMYKENELRDSVKSSVSRGKLTVVLAVESTTADGMQMKINMDTARAYHESLKELRKQLKIKETVKFEHLLQCTEIYGANDINGDDPEETWELISDALHDALGNLNDMRKKEGRELARDLQQRMKSVEKNVEKIEKMSLDKVPQERQRLRERIGKLFESDEIDEQRLEMEIVMLADKLDISEECVRMRSHIKFFLEAMKGRDQAGRKINFLLQEMNREVNTMGSKGNDAQISQTVVEVKEELEKIREQVQNVE